MRGELNLWTDERVALLQKLWREGAPASAIAVQLGGMSRSAVLGKINRLRRLASSGAPSTKRQSKTADALPSHHSPQPSPARRRGDQFGSPYATAKAGGKRLLELNNKSCRWPLGNPGSPRFMFCGAPEANLERGIPYCRRHMRRAYLRPEPASRNSKLAVVSAGEPTATSPNATAPRASVWRSRVHSPTERWR